MTNTNQFCTEYHQSDSSLILLGNIFSTFMIMIFIFNSDYIANNFFCLLPCCFRLEMKEYFPKDVKFLKDFKTEIKIYIFLEMFLKFLKKNNFYYFYINICYLLFFRSSRPLNSSNISQ